jgi:hypothetical protein
VKIAEDIKLALLAGGVERKKRKDCTTCSLRSHLNRKRKFYSVVLYLFAVMQSLEEKQAAAYAELAAATTELERNNAQRKVEWLAFCQRLLIEREYFG